MNVDHKITAYDRGSEKLVLAYHVPADRLAAVRDIARIPVLEDDDFGAFPIDQKLIRQVCFSLDLSPDVDPYDWFLEPFARENLPGLEHQAR